MTGPEFGLLGQLREAVLALDLRVESMSVRESSGPGDGFGWLAVCYDPGCQVAGVEWTSTRSPVWKDTVGALREHARRHGGGV